LFFGDHLEAWGFDPLFEEGVGPLIAANKHPERIRYLNLGLGAEDGERAFRFIPENPSSSFFAAANGSDRPDETWQIVELRRLDTLFANGTIGEADFIKMDSETYEVEIIKGGHNFLRRSGVFGVESEVGFSELHETLGLILWISMRNWHRLILRSTTQGCNARRGNPLLRAFLRRQRPADT
jgi:FkbM family methyltransferase